MENVYENVKKELTPSVIKETLEMMLKKCTEVGTSENSKKLQETKEEASNDMILLVKLVFPVVIDLQMECLPLVGLPATKEGLKEFLQAMNLHITQDEEIFNLAMQIRQVYLPILM